VLNAIMVSVANKLLMLNVVMLNVVMLSVALLNVVAPSSLFSSDQGKTL
jgi:hypothetical protein